eukprot:2143693-Prymnesium_polylepis.1
MGSSMAGGRSSAMAAGPRAGPGEGAFGLIGRATVAAVVERPEDERQGQGQEERDRPRRHDDQLARVDGGDTAQDADGERRRAPKGERARARDGQGSRREWRVRTAVSART